MPPFNYKNYPSNWKSEIRPSILKRANNRCEQCNVENGSAIFRGIHKNIEVYQDIEGRIYNADNGEYIVTDFYADIRPLSGDPNQQAIKVVLTIAHTCHDPMCTDPHHLKALCQLHHLRFDIGHHNQTRRSRMKKKMGLQDLFENT